MRKEKVRYRSVSSRYRVGLILILVVALLAMGISQFFNVVEHNAYNRAMDNLLEINGLFVQLDKVMNACMTTICFSGIEASRAFGRNPVRPAF